MGSVHSTIIGFRDDSDFNFTEISSHNTAIMFNDWNPETSQRKILPLAEILLKRKANPNTVFRKRPLLWWAVDERDLDMVELLLQWGANACMTFGWGDEPESPLSYAARIGNVKMVRLILEYREDLNQTFYNDLNKALYSAVESQHLESQHLESQHLESQHYDVSPLLLKMGADPSVGLEAALWCGSLKSIDLFVNNGANMDTTDKNKFLRHAIRRGMMDCARFLCKAGANPNEFLNSALLGRDLKKATICIHLGGKVHYQRLCTVISECAGRSYRDRSLNFIWAIAKYQNDTASTIARAILGDKRWDIVRLQRLIQNGRAILIKENEWGSAIARGPWRYGANGEACWRNVVSFLV